MPRRRATGLTIGIRGKGGSPGSADAREFREKSLMMRRQELGNEHRDTLKSMDSLAAVLEELSEKERTALARARTLRAEALAVRRRVFGDEHPDTRRSMDRLAAVLEKLGEQAAARELRDQAFAERLRWLDVTTKRHLDARRDTNHPTGAGETARAEAFGGVSNVAQWVVATIVSGVVGSVSYDLLKHVIRRSKRFNRSAAQDDNGLLIARFAVIARCRELRLSNTPATITSLRLLSTTTDNAGRTEFHLFSNDLEARVVLPSGDLQGHEIEVTLWGFSDEV